MQQGDERQNEEERLLMSCEEERKEGMREGRKNRGTKDKHEVVMLIRRDPRDFQPMSPSATLGITTA